MKNAQIAVMDTKPSQFVHSHELCEGEPDWKTINPKELPATAFAIVGDKEDEKSWMYPHHFVQGGQEKDNHGRVVNGTLFLHTIGLQQATKAAEKDGNEQAKRHLDMHWKTVDPDRDGHFRKDVTGSDAYQKQVTKPVYAFSMPVMMTLGDNGEGAVSAPVELVALSGEVLERPEWGPCIQELKGMSFAGRIAIDYMHDPTQLVGYVNKCDIGSGKLVLNGALVPQRTHQRTEEIISNMRAGVPYEASIYFPPWRPDELQIEQIEEGVAIVDGKEIPVGPQGLTVFRKWPLRGVAIVPHGADGQTAAYLQADKKELAAISITRRGKVMLKENESVEAEKKAELQQAAAEQAAKKQEVEVEVDEDEEEDGKKGREEFKRFQKKFGDMASKYFADGLSFEEAERVHAYLEEQKKTIQAAPAKPAPAPVSPKAVRSKVPPDVTDVEQSAASPLSEKEQAELDAYCQAMRISPEVKKTMAEKHHEFKEVSRKQGVYQKSEGVEPNREMQKVNEK